MHHGQRPQQWPSASAVKAVAFGQQMLCPFRFAPSRCRSTRGSTPCTACGCSHSLAQPAAGHSVGDSKTQSGGRGLRPSQSCAPSGLRSTKSQPPALHSLRLLAQLAPEERVCRFAPRSRFAPEQCVSFCRFAPRSRLQRQRGRDSVRIISLRSRLDPRAAPRVLGPQEPRSRFAPQKCVALALSERNAAHNTRPGALARCARLVVVCPLFWSVSRCGRALSRTQGTHTRKGPPLWDHPLRMCAWLGKPDCSRQRPAD